MRILLLRTWITNIGNGFIDKGARATVERAFPNAEIIETSGHGNMAAARRTKGLLPNLFSSRDEARYGRLYKDNNDSPIHGVTNIAELVDVDLAIFPGCILYEHALEKYYKVFKKLNESNVPVILLGAGGGDYSKDTQRYVRQFIDEVEPIGLITRDSDAYECYKDDIPFTYDGIDNAFFIDEWYDPPSANTDYDVATFDKIEAKVQSPRQLIHADHFPVEQPYGDIWQKLKKMKKQWGLFQQDNYFLSDTLEDYLFLYANTRVTHSDRIHACIPTLVYGNRAQFWFETPRAALFDKVLSEDITESPVSLDSSVISRVKQEQVNALQKASKEMK
ncbi:polysaccharide pyruvyl transferase family protein [Haloferax volcanii]|uniref:Polysaccharide pyruvyl transferase family protein n=1 Tax=Haloferax volcanii TaxID=2246 RepID=A0A6C0UVC7_HALVO|nr:polysaccharide pyruvyl transferase family protein [Haloferax alexandrinus]QIB79140.1 polysaccharide pyruvyl transferase family protein [Haloferax alexandrinus]